MTEDLFYGDKKTGESIPEKNKTNAYYDNLKLVYGFIFARFSGRNNVAVRTGQYTDPHDHKFPAQYNDNHPTGDDLSFREGK